MKGKVKFLYPTLRQGVVKFKWGTRQVEKRDGVGTGLNDSKERKET